MLPEIRSDSCALVGCLGGVLGIVDDAVHVDAIERSIAQQNLAVNHDERDIQPAGREDDALGSMNRGESLALRRWIAITSAFLPSSSEPMS